MFFFLFVIWVIVVDGQTAEDLFEHNNFHQLM